MKPQTPYPLTTDFSGKTVCITGATAGIGLACAEVFIAAGATVIGTGRRQERLDALAKQHGAAFIPLRLDVTDRAAVFKALAGEQIDILVNNAGLGLGLDRADHASLDDWETMVDTNIKGVMYCTKTVLPEMGAPPAPKVIRSVAFRSSPLRGLTRASATNCALSASRNLRRSLSYRFTVENGSQIANCGKTSSRPQASRIVVSGC